LRYLSHHAIHSVKYFAVICPLHIPLHILGQSVDLEYKCSILFVFRQTAKTLAFRSHPNTCFSALRRTFQSKSRSFQLRRNISNMVSFKPLVISAVVLATPISVIATDQAAVLVSRQLSGLLGGVGGIVQGLPLVGSLLGGTPAVAPAPVPVSPAPAYAYAPAPVRPAPVPVSPAPAPAPAPASAPAPAPAVQVTTALQVVTTIQFYSTRSISIYQLTQALVNADVALYSQGQGNLSVFTPRMFL
jgi:hypothetical protein